MVKERFEVKIRGVGFTINLYQFTNNTKVLYITHEISSSDSFFMSNIENKGWEILYTNDIDKEVLSFEEDIIKAIEEKGY